MEKYEEGTIINNRDGRHGYRDKRWGRAEGPVGA